MLRNLAARGVMEERCLEPRAYSNGVLARSKLLDEEPAMDFKLNFIGVSVTDFATSFDFYTRVLGLKARHSTPGWAYLESTGMVFELFSEARGTARWQAVRPAIQVTRLEPALAELRTRGVSLADGLERTPLGDEAGFMAPEDIQWRVAHAPGLPAAEHLQLPHIGWVELFAEQVDGQRLFYSEVMGLRAEQPGGRDVLLRQAPGEPLIILRPGGRRHTAGYRREMPRAGHPVTLSFETKDIQEASAYLASRRITVIQDVTHKAWGGTDMYIADADGNPVQVVQYS
jgi:predicted enzyme related to lactoylglutathione lyase